MDADEINKHLGSAMRAIRTNLGLSQQVVGSEMSVTFQQIQKYEKGTNSLTVARLFEIAAVLKTTPGAIIAKAMGRPNKEEIDFSQRATMEMVKRIAMLNAQERKAVSAFIRTLTAGRKTI